MLLLLTMAMRRNVGDMVCVCVCVCAANVCVTEITVLMGPFTAATPRTVSPLNDVSLHNEHRCTRLRKLNRTTLHSAQCTSTHTRDGATADTSRRNNNERTTASQADRQMTDSSRPLCANVVRWIGAHAKLRRGVRAWKCTTGGRSRRAFGCSRRRRRRRQRRRH